MRRRLTTMFGRWLLAVTMWLGGMATAQAWSDAELAALQKSKGELWVQYEVVNRGVLQLGKDEKITLEEAIKRAGGFTRSASKKLFLTHLDANGEVQLLTKDLSGGAPDDAKFLVGAGDKIDALKSDAAEAAERKAQGEVVLYYSAIASEGRSNRPERMILTLGKGETVTLKEAIKRVGGFSRTASKQVRVGRFDAGGNPLSFTKDLGVSESEGAGFLVEAGDVIFGFEDAAKAVAARKARGELVVSGMIVNSRTQILAEDEKIPLREAIKRAGGFGRIASGRVRVTRLEANGEYQVFRKHLRRSTEINSPNGDFLVEAGDVIYAEEIID